MRIILTGGCTGGHIYPAIAIGNKFREMQADCDILYIGCEGGIEDKIVPNAGYELIKVTSDWFNRSKPLTLPITLLNTMKGTQESLKIMKEFKPDAVISTGSFVSVPVVRAAAKLNVPIFIQEQNAFPGLSNKVLSKYAKKIFLGFESARTQFKETEKCVNSGNPVRSDFSNRDKLADRKELDLPADDLVIMAFGGSLGSETINEIGLELTKKYSGVKGVSVIWGTGRDYFDEVQATLKEQNVIVSENVRITPYIDGMPQTLSVSDVVISRSGALSVAEITMCGRAAIFIPSPNVTADHQYYNAKAVADAGGALLFRENDETKDKVISAIEKLSSKPDKLAEMNKASLSLAPTEATSIIYNSIMSYLEGYERN